MTENKANAKYLKVQRKHSQKLCYGEKTFGANYQQDELSS